MEIRVKNYLICDDADILQINLYRFHGCGIGNILTQEEILYTMIIRLISISKGHSGVSMELLEAITALINKRYLSGNPLQGISRCKRRSYSSILYSPQHLPEKERRSFKESSYLQKKHSWRVDLNLYL